MACQGFGGGPRRDTIRHTMRSASWILVLVLFVAACSPTLPPAPPSAPPPDWQSYEGFLVPARLLPLRAVGSVLFDYRGERESGDVDIEAQLDLAFLLRLSTRLLGTSALEVRFDPSRLLVLDFADESYIHGANNSANRLALFSLDIAPDEFLTILTGRVPREVFERGGGTRAANGQAIYQGNGGINRFTLGDDGLPRGWIKQRDGVTLFRVEYRAYMVVRSAGGVDLRLPRKIRVYAGDVYADGPSPRMVLGIREFRLWTAGETPVSFQVHPESGLEYRPMPEHPHIPRN